MAMYIQPNARRLRRELPANEIFMELPDLEDSGIDSDEETPANPGVVVRNAVFGGIYCIEEPDEHEFDDYMKSIKREKGLVRFYHEEDEDPYHKFLKTIRCPPVEPLDVPSPAASVSGSPTPQKAAADSEDDLRIEDLSKGGPIKFPRVNRSPTSSTSESETENDGTDSDDTEIEVTKARPLHGRTEAIDEPVASGSLSGSAAEPTLEELKLFKPTPPFQIVLPAYLSYDETVGLFELPHIYRSPTQSSNASLSSIEENNESANPGEEPNVSSPTDSEGSSPIPEVKLLETEAEELAESSRQPYPKVTTPLLEEDTNTPSTSVDDSADSPVVDINAELPKSPVPSQSNASQTLTDNMRDPDDLDIDTELPKIRSKLSSGRRPQIPWTPTEFNREINTLDVDTELSKSMRARYLKAAPVKRSNIPWTPTELMRGVHHLGEEFESEVLSNLKMPPGMRPPGLWSSTEFGTFFKNPVDQELVKFMNCFLKEEPTKLSNVNHSASDAVEPVDEGELSKSGEDDDSDLELVKSKRSHNGGHTPENSDSADTPSEPHRFE